MYVIGPLYLQVLLVTSHAARETHDGILTFLLSWT